MTDNSTLSGSSYLSSSPPTSTTSSGSSKLKKKLFKGLFSGHGHGNNSSNNSSNSDHPGRNRSATTSTEFYQDDEEFSSEDEKSIDLNSYSATITPLCFKHNSKSNKREIAKNLTEKLQIIDDEDFEKYLIQPKYIKNFRKCVKPAIICKRLFLAQELNQNDNNNPSDPSTPDLVVDEFIKSDGFQNDTDQNDSPKKAIYAMKFSPDGKFLASAGKGNIIKIWKVIASPLDRMEQSSTPSTNGFQGLNLNDLENDHDTKKTMYASVFQDVPYRIFSGHQHDILSLDWSKNNFLLSSSMDKTVKLWNVNQSNCLRTYTHGDFVPSIKFHPTDDRFFLSGCLDHKVRLWSILDNEVSYEFDCKNLVTAVSFTPNGNLTIAGTFNGNLYFLDTKNLELRHSLVINQKKNNNNGSKVTGIETFFDKDDVKVLITTNDSRIRLLSLRQRQLIEYFKGLENNSSQIIATVSEDKKYIISGSENHWVYIWKNHKDENDDLSKLKTSNNFKKLINHDKKKRKDYTSFHAHHSVVTCALIAPSGTAKALSLSNDYIYELNTEFYKAADNLNDAEDIYDHDHSFYEDSLIKEDMIGSVIVTSDDTGLIRVFRQDFSSTVRKLLIEEKNKKAKPELIPSGLNSSDHRTVFLHKGLNRSNSSNLSKATKNYNKTLNTHTQGSKSGYTSGSVSGNRSRSGTLDSNKGINVAALNQQLLNHKNNHLICDVCNSEKFKVTKTGNSSEIGIFCTDCGNQLNT
ncbi:putative WD repeat-containing protein [Wickerhamomyces ciferrii]|uniref:WD repeat-containing protein n=1 Tax=Wickerhamomyces ciferrii (strain ATCC 14091 / BCRC 22168 / CBS 111 / JCM 3599 / NBRC 0793 / NRRL Y-1031 F-60-10) TaxID=1206466 RepID=K0KBD8_WICCF|nr:putative WD repeat-containing protein [Wickerhamomyces ciferrii]CCH42325.1 putative WD repeat-containing protein [Wickerhamomyces ciferrii]